MWAKVVLAAVSCERRAAAAVDTPAESIDVVADEPDGREDVGHVVQPPHLVGRGIFTAQMSKLAVAD